MKTAEFWIALMTAFSITQEIVDDYLTNVHNVYHSFKDHLLVQLVQSMGLTAGLSVIHGVTTVVFGNFSKKSPSDYELYSPKTRSRSERARRLRHKETKQDFDTSEDIEIPLELALCLSRNQMKVKVDAKSIKMNECFKLLCGKRIPSTFFDCLKDPVFPQMFSEALARELPRTKLTLRGCSIVVENAFKSTCSNIMRLGNVESIMVKQACGLPSLQLSVLEKGGARDFKKFIKERVDAAEMDSFVNNRERYVGIDVYDTNRKCGAVLSRMGFTLPSNPMSGIILMLDVLAGMGKNSAVMDCSKFLYESAQAHANIEDIWAENMRQTCNEFKSMVDMFESRISSHDISEHLAILSTCTTSDTIWSYTLRLQGFVGEACLSRLHGMQYMDEALKMDFGKILEKYAKKCRRQDTDMSSLEYYRSLVSRFTELSRCLRQTPDYYKFSAADRKLTIFEFGLCETDKTRATKIFTDTRKWEIVKQLSEIINIELVVDVAGSLQIATRLDTFPGGEYELGLLKSFLKFSAIMRSTVGRIKTYNEFSNENFQTDARNFIKKKRGFPQIDDSAEKLNLDAFLKSPDAYAESGMQVPPGLKEIYRANIEQYTGARALLTPKEVLDCVRQANTADRKCHEGLEENWDAAGFCKSAGEKMNLDKYEEHECNFALYNHDIQRIACLEGCIECSCKEDEEIMEFMSRLSEMVRATGPGGKVSKDAEFKIKDKTSKQIISFCYEFDEVYVANRQGRLIRCFMKGDERSKRDLKGYLAELCKMNKKDSEIEKLAKLVDGETPTSDIDVTGCSYYMECIAKCLKYRNKGIEPCRHNNFVFDKYTWRVFKERVGSRVNNGEMSTSTTSNMMKDHTPKKVKWYLPSLITEERLFSIKSTRANIRARVGTLMDINESKVRRLLVEGNTADLKLIGPSVEWVVQVLLQNHWYRVLLAEDLIYQAIDKGLQLKNGMSVHSISPALNLVINNISQDQVVYFFQCKATGETTEAEKMEKRCNASKSKVLALVTSLIASHMELQGLIRPDIDPTDFDSGIESIDRIAEISNFARAAFLQCKSGDCGWMVKAIQDLMPARQQGVVKRVNELIAYNCLIVAPVIAENSKSLNAVLQMSRYFYSYSFAEFMDIKGLLGKLDVLIRKPKSQIMFMILSACYIRNVIASQSIRLKRNFNVYSEREKTSAMINFYQNLEQIEDSMQFINCIYNVHAFERMEMDSRETVNAYNMFCEKAIEFKKDLSECLSRLCAGCGEDLNNEPEKKYNIENGDFYRNKVFWDCPECEDTLLELECFLGIQIMRRKNRNDLKEKLTRKMVMCAEKNSKYSFNCWELTQCVGQNFADSIKQQRMDTLANDDVMHGEVSEFMSTTNCVPKFSMQYNPVEAQEKFKREKVDKVMDKAERQWRKIYSAVKEDSRDFENMGKEVMEKIMREAFTGLEDDSDFVRTCSENIQKRVVKLGKDRRAGDYGSFEDVCRNSGNSLSMICKDWFSAVKGGRCSDGRIGTVLSRLRKVVMDEINGRCGEVRYLTPAKRMQVLSALFDSPKSDLSACIKEFKEDILEANVGIQLKTGQKVCVGEKIQLDEDFEAECTRLYKDTVYFVEKQRGGKQRFDMDKDIIRGDMIALRNERQEEFMNVFVNCLNKFLKYTVRWGVDRDNGAFMSIWFDPKSNPLKITEEDMLTDSEWLCLSMLLNDYDLEGLFQEDLTHKSVEDQMKSLAMTVDKTELATTFIFSLDMAIHSRVQQMRQFLNRRRMALVGDKSEKVVIALIKLARERGMTNIAEICKAVCEDVDCYYQCRIAAKQQFGPIRDLVVMRLDFRVLQYFVELSAKMILRDQSHDMMMNIQRKDGFLNSCRDNYESEVRDDNMGFLAINGDCSSWGPKHRNMAFLMTLSAGFQKNDFIGSCFRNFMLKACRKEIHIGDPIARRCHGMLLHCGLRFTVPKTNKGSKYDIIDKHGNIVQLEDLEKIYNIPPQASHIIWNQLRHGRPYFRTEPHMGQGISHMVSSAYHCAVLNYLDELIALHNPHLEMNSICSSDDYGISYRSKVEVQSKEFVEQVKNWERVRRTFTISCNIMDSSKSFASNCLYEIYSQFSTPKTRLSPYTKQLCAMSTAPIGITPLDENSLSWDMGKDVYEHGGSLFITNVGLLCRNMSAFNVTSRKIMESWEILSEKDDSHYDGWNPWINNIRALSTEDMMSEMADVIVDIGMDRCRKREPGLNDMIFASALVSVKDEKTLLKKKQASVKSQNLVGNPVRFKAPLSHEKLREKLDMISKEEVDGNKSSVVKKLIFSNQRAYDFESAMDKFRQALSSNSIIYNLIGFSSEQVRNLCRMARGGYYWAANEYIDGPCLKLGKVKLLSISNIDKWILSEDRVSVCEEALTMYGQAKKTEVGLKEQVRAQVECLRSEYNVKKETTLTKRVFYRNRTHRPLKNQPGQIIAFCLDPQAALDTGTDIMLDHIERDKKVLEEIKPGCVRKLEGMGLTLTNEEVDYCVTLCEQLRLTKGSQLSVILQESSRLRYSKDSEMLCRGKLFMNRIYEITSEVTKVDLVTRSDRVYEKLTLLNQLNPRKFDINATFDSLCSAGLAEEITMASIACAKEASKSAQSAELADAVGSFNRTARQVREMDVRVMTTRMNEGGVEMDKLVYQSGRKSNRKEGYLIMTFENGVMKCATSTDNAMDTCKMIKRYTEYNRIHFRIGRPCSGKDFFNMLSDSEGRCVQVCMSINDLVPKVGGREQSGTKKIKIDRLVTKPMTGESYEEFAIFGGAIRQNRRKGLCFGHFTKPLFEMDDLKVLQMMINTSDGPLEQMIKKMLTTDEFVEDRCISDVAEVSLETMLECVRCLKARDPKAYEETAKFSVKKDSTDLIFRLAGKTKMIENDDSVENVDPKAAGYETLLSMVHAINNLLKTGKINKEYASSAASCLHGMLTTVKEEEMNNVFKDFVGLSMKIEDYLKFSSHSEIGKILGQNFIQGRSGSGIKSLNATSDLKVVFNRNENDIDLTLAGRTKSMSKKLTLLHKTITPFNNPLLKCRISKINGRVELSMRCPLQECAFIDGITSFLCSEADKSNGGRRAIFIYLFCRGFITIKELLENYGLAEPLEDGESIASDDSLDRLADFDDILIEDEKDDLRLESQLRAYYSGASPVMIKTLFDQYNQSEERRDEFSMMFKARAAVQPEIDAKAENIYAALIRQDTHGKYGQKEEKIEEEDSEGVEPVQVNLDDWGFGDGEEGYSADWADDFD